MPAINIVIGHRSRSSTANETLAQRQGCRKHGSLFEMHHILYSVSQVTQGSWTPIEVISRSSQPILLANLDQTSSGLADRLLDIRSTESLSGFALHSLLAQSARSVSATTLDTVHQRYAMIQHCTQENQEDRECHISAFSFTWALVRIRCYKLSPSFK